MPKVFRTAHIFEKKWRSDDVRLTVDADFSSLLLSERVLSGLKVAGYKKPSPIQLEAIPVGKFGKDLIVKAKSGTGKTLVFTVVALEALLDVKHPQVLIVVPTREIAIQICDVIKKVGSGFEDLTCSYFIGGTTLEKDIDYIHNCKIVIGTPGRLRHLMTIGIIPTNSIRLLVLDEADELLEPSFKNEIDYIFQQLPKDKQVIATSATYPKELKKFKNKYFQNAYMAVLNATEHTLLGMVHYIHALHLHKMPVLAYQVKLSALEKILTSVKFTQCLVFCNLVSKVESLSADIREWGFSTDFTSSAKEQHDRMKTMKGLKRFEYRVLVSSDLTARGIDAENVDLVINFDNPFKAENYFHRCGRAGRFGSKAVAITFLTDEEVPYFKQMKDDENFQVYNLPDPIPSNLLSLRPKNDASEEFAKNKSSTDDDSESNLDNDVVNEDSVTNGENHVTTPVNKLDKNEMEISEMTDTLDKIQSQIDSLAINSVDINSSDEILKEDSIDAISDNDARNEIDIECEVNNSEKKYLKPTEYEDSFSKYINSVPKDFESINQDFATNIEIPNGSDVFLKEPNSDNVSNQEFIPPINELIACDKSITSENIVNNGDFQHVENGAISTKNNLSSENLQQSQKDNLNEVTHSNSSVEKCNSKSVDVSKDQENSEQKYRLQNNLPSSLCNFSEIDESLAYEFYSNGIQKTVDAYLENYEANVTFNDDEEIFQSDKQNITTEEKLEFIDKNISNLDKSNVTTSDKVKLIRASLDNYYYNVFRKYRIQCIDEMVSNATSDNEILKDLKTEKNAYESDKKQVSPCKKEENCFTEFNATDKTEHGLKNKAGNVAQDELNLQLTKENSAESISLSLQNQSNITEIVNNAVIEDKTDVEQTVPHGKFDDLSDKSIREKIFNKVTEQVIDFSEKSNSSEGSDATESSDSVSKNSDATESSDSVSKNSDATPKNVSASEIASFASDNSDSVSESTSSASHDSDSVSDSSDSFSNSNKAIAKSGSFKTKVNITEKSSMLKSNKKCRSNFSPNKKASYSSTSSDSSSISSKSFQFKNKLVKTSTSKSDDYATAKEVKNMNTVNNIDQSSISDSSTESQCSTDCHSFCDTKKKNSLSMKTYNARKTSTPKQYCDNFTERPYALFQHNIDNFYQRHQNVSQKLNFEKDSCIKTPATSEIPSTSKIRNTEKLPYIKSMPRNVPLSSPTCSSNHYEFQSNSKTSKNLKRNGRKRDMPGREIPTHRNFKDSHFGLNLNSSPFRAHTGHVLPNQRIPHTLHSDHRCHSISDNPHCYNDTCQEWYNTFVNMNRVIQYYSYAMY